MIKVLHLIESFRGGGKERQLVEYLKYNSKGVQSEVVQFKDLNDYPETANLSMKFHVLKRRIKKDPTVFFGLKKIIKQFDPDIIQSWGTMPSIFALPYVAFSKRCFVNMCIRNAICKTFSSNWIRSRLTFPFSDMVLANSYAGLENYKAPLHKSSVVYNGVHLSRFDNIPEREELKLKFGFSTKYVVGMVGAFHKRKDFKTYILSAISILKKRDDVTFVTIGNGSELERMKDLVPQSFNTKVLFLGRKSNVEHYLKTFDIGVLMTNPKVHREGISNSIVEYMAMGVPVIASFGGGTPEIVDNNVNGYVIQPYNVSLLEQKIIRLLDDEGLKNGFAINAMHKVQNGFVIDNMMNSFEEIYSNLLIKQKK